MGPDPIDRHGLAQRVVGGLVVGEQRQVADVALVAGAHAADVAQLHLDHAVTHAGPTVVTTSTVPPVPLYLVRHTKAGSRATWKGRDEDRPLSSTGRKQAERLGKWLAKQDVTQTLSSPYVRCMQTLEPTAKRLGMKVEPVDVLAEHGPIPPVLELLEALPDNTALCTHGDILMGTIGALILRRSGTVGRAGLPQGHHLGDRAPQGPLGGSPRAAAALIAEFAALRRRAPREAPATRRSRARRTAGPTSDANQPAAMAAPAEPLADQKSLSACWTFTYQMMWPMIGSRNQRPQMAETGLCWPSRS